MTQIPVNNMNNVTPLYSYPVNYTAAPQTSTVQITPQNGNQQIYQYPTASLYDTSKQAMSGVNIHIYNPSAIGGPTSSANASYVIPGQTTVHSPVTSPVTKNVDGLNSANDGSSASNTASMNTILAQTPLAANPIQETTSQKTKEIVDLTDDYVKTLESYLRNSSYEVRKTGIKELIKRYEEDSSRYDDPAMTALLNIALQDPEASNRIFAMSPIASGSAHGDANTIEILKKLQQSEKMYGQEAKMATDSLLNCAQVKIAVPDNSPDKNK